ncbi:YcfL family protein [Puniceicoccales bacterium CK1056]|uniref:YcfL family protein n=1 Tax=Oceanipulchritudo coccoides TaxID=2706888 RepID=A0A6B2M4F5_9BACT|nr:DUF1425 domain-containing protein [Oceanipulchritudo coccoides]NDV62967.1 YcfL family protein [Oceanipulchritudo coccoides]
MKIQFCITIALLTLVGCQTSQPVGEVYDGETRLITYTGVGLNIEGRLNDEGTLDPAPFVGQFLPSQDMKIVGARATSTPNGFPRVQFSIESRRDKTSAVQYRFTWYDREGFVVQQDQNPWQSLHLAGREVADIESIARSNRAKAFRLIIRPLEFKK